MFFFIAFIIVGSLFILNLFVGVVINMFSSEKDKLSKNHLLTRQQQEWVQIQLMHFKAKPIKKMRYTGNNLVKRVCISITLNPWFDSIIMVFIILNTIVLGLKWYGEPEALPNILEIINYIFAGIFTVEAFIKLIALGKGYFQDGWNVFDFVIVIGTYIGVTITATTNVSVGPQTTIIRSFRIGRIFRLVKQAKSLRLIFNTFVVTIPSLANIGGLLTLLLYLYSILGVFLFAPVKLQEYMNVHANFEGFGIAFLTLIRMATGEGWNYIMMDSKRQKNVLFDCVSDPTYEDYVDNDFNTVGCGSSVAFLYFVSFLLMVTFIFLNLFIAIILQGFSDTNKSENLRISENDF